MAEKKFLINGCRNFLLNNSPYAKTIIIHDHVLDLNHDLPLKYSEEHEHDEDQERLYNLPAESVAEVGKQPSRL